MFSKYAVFLLIVLSSALAKAEHLTDIRVGVLSYGTVNWEMDTIKHHGLDHANGVNLVAVKLTSKNAAAIALQSNAVDVILTDLFWVLKQQGDYVIQPTHQLTGGIYVKDSDTSLSDIKTLGVAGGANDKNLLVFKAYLANRELPLPEQVKFAAPPLLNQLISKGQFDAAMNFWHYNARLSAKGFVNILPTSEMLSELGVNQSVPLLGWVFGHQFATESVDVLEGFLQASQLAKQRLLSDAAEWQRLRPIMRVDTDEDFDALVSHYKKTVLTQRSDNTLEAAKSLFLLVKNLDNQTVFPDDFQFPDNVFYRSNTSEATNMSGTK